MNTLTRKEAALLLGAAVMLSHCSGRRGNAVVIGSKNFTEEFIIAEIYAQVLERAGVTVVRKFDLGSTQIAMAALRRGDIDLYPEYTGTALIDVLHLPPMRDANALYHRVSREFEKRYALRWLEPSPMNDSQGLATTQAISKQYKVTTLSALSRVAPQLRLGAIPEFLSRADALPGLQKFYGGFRFKDVKTYDIGLKYRALLHGDADVVTAFTTDGAIAANNLVVLKDDKQFWPEYHIAPVVRIDALKRAPLIAATLNRISPAIDDAAARSMNYAVDVRKQDSADVAAAFLKAHTR
ncbi:MAG: glycine/betaine ABC transporter substrate-binding protein [Candidatus Eremiobacteraeota bacterium]|nr:glycine/betaine ABC transporter substrate-binding protein [Candidatus Eremiobacteraeota bacterium]